MFTPVRKLHLFSAVGSAATSDDTVQSNPSAAAVFGANQHCVRVCVRVGVCVWCEG